MLVGDGHNVNDPGLPLTGRKQGCKKQREKKASKLEAKGKSPSLKEKLWRRREAFMRSFCKRQKGPNKIYNNTGNTSTQVPCTQTIII